MKRYGFKCDHCTRILIEYFEVGKYDEPAKNVEISDPETLKEILSYLSQLPEKGDVMISMAPVDITNVVMCSESEEVEFSFYSNKLKAPDTAFYKGDLPAEKDLRECIEKLLETENT